MRVGLKVKTQPELFKASWPIELVEWLLAPHYDFELGKYRNFGRLAHVLIPDCRPGDILDCSGTVQISNNTGLLVEYSAALVLTPDASGVAGIADPVSVSDGAEPPNGRWITRFPGFNVTTNPGGMHHAPFTRHSRYQIPEDVSGDQYVAFIAYASAQPVYDRSVKVDQNCGDLTVLRFR